jgi:hypothetical protein
VKAVNAEGVVSQSPGLTAAFCGQPWDKVSMYLNPERVVSERNPFRVEIAFTFSPGLAKSTPILGFETLPHWDRMQTALKYQAKASASRVGYSEP